MAIIGTVAEGQAGIVQRCRGGERRGSFVARHCRNGCMRRGKAYC